MQTTLVHAEDRVTILQAYCDDTHAGLADMDAHMSGRLRGHDNIYKKHAEETDRWCVNHSARCSKLNKAVRDVESRTHVASPLPQLLMRSIPGVRWLASADPLGHDN